MILSQKLPQEGIEANIVIIGSGGGMAAAVEGGRKWSHRYSGAGEE